MEGYSREAEKRIKEVFTGNKKTLNLSHLGLKAFPKDIKHLITLEHLDISGNEIRSIPRNHLSPLQLKSLNMSRNKLSAFPEDIFDSESIEDLYLSGNSIQEIPLRIGSLFNLRVLDLFSNSVNKISDSIRELSNLEKLDLGSNQLSGLPKSIGELGKLAYLDIGENLINKFPSEIFSLENLKVLSVSGNYLDSIPKEFSKLQNLETFCFASNRFKEIPDVVFEIESMESIAAGDNPIEKFSERICNLRNLKVIDLSRRSSVVLTVNSLVKTKNNLRWINSENRNPISMENVGLRSLPQSLQEIEALEHIFLHGNDFLLIPEEILGPPCKEYLENGNAVQAKDLLNYYFRATENEQPLNEAKLILVGFGAVGKTSLVNRLLHNNFDLQSAKTEGIQITKWPLRLNDAEDITLHVWDFGGQEIMHSTHQFFLTERSLYLLVLNGRQGHEDEDADYWLELIQSFGGGSPVIVVLNKIHEHPFDVNRGALQQKFPNIRKFICTDCETETGLAELRAAIEQETDTLEHLRDPFPRSWVAIKDRLSQMADNYISFEQYRQFCQHDGEADRSAQDSLAVHLHSLGIALNYKDDPRLRDTHVLNPHWVTNGIYTLLNAPELADRKGELAATCLDRLLDASHYPPERHGFLLDLMRKFELCFRFEEDDSRFLIPDLLDKQQPEAATSFDPHQCLNFRYQYPILPEGLLPRFIVRTHVLSDDQLRWRTGVILTFEGNRALVKADRSDRTVTISVDGPVASRRRLLAVIRSNFEHIHRNFKFTLQELVPIPEHPDIVLAYDDLLVMEQDGLTELPQVINGRVVKLNVRELLQGIDLSGYYPRIANERRYLGAPRFFFGAPRLFYSYAHEDEHLRDELEIHLKLLERQGLIQPWHDRRIQPGVDWRQELDRNLEQADIILLLVSPSFIASDYCYEIEMSRALERHQAGDATVIPILIRPVNWDAVPFSHLQALPNDLTPVTQWPDADNAWLDVEKGLEAAIQTRLRT
jgi:internalin A